MIAAHLNLSHRVIDRTPRLCPSVATEMLDGEERMNVIPFPSQRCGHGAKAVGHASMRASRPSALPCFDGHHAAAGGTLLVNLATGAIQCSGAATSGIVATKLFAQSGGTLRAADNTIHDKIEALLADLASGNKVQARAMFVNAAGVWLVEAFPLSLASGEQCGLLVVAEARPAPWSVTELMSAYGLTEREADVALGLLRGRPVQEIAQRLSLQTGTVRQYLKGIYSKTYTSNQAQLLAFLNGGFVPDHMGAS